MSREAELYKDKIEVSLDGRQIFYLFFGGSVVVGLVFVLGVMVGRRVEARGHVDRARVAATVDPLAALDRLEGGTGLSFQGSLRGNDGPSTDVEKHIAALDKPADPKADKAKKLEGPKADVKPEPKVDAKADAKKDEPKAEAKKDEAKKDEAKKADAKVEPKVDGKTETKKDEAKKTDAKKDEAKVAKADEPKAEPKKDEKKEEKKQRFTLQLSSFQEKSEAEALVASVKAAGHDAHITEGVVDGKQYFRVRTGSYKSMEAATEAKGELEKISNKSAIVTRL
jgi:cell division protein FtsN